MQTAAGHNRYAPDLHRYDPNLPVSERFALANDDDARQRYAAACCVRCLRRGRGATYDILRSIGGTLNRQIVDSQQECSLDRRREQYGANK